MKWQLCWDLKDDQLRWTRRRKYFKNKSWVWWDGLPLHFYHFSLFFPFPLLPLFLPPFFISSSSSTLTLISVDNNSSDFIVEGFVVSTQVGAYKGNDILWQKRIQKLDCKCSMMTTTWEGFNPPNSQIVTTPNFYWINPTYHFFSIDKAMSRPWEELIGSWQRNSSGKRQTVCRYCGQGSKVAQQEWVGDKRTGWGGTPEELLKDFRAPAKQVLFLSQMASHTFLLSLPMRGFRFLGVWGKA